MLDGYVELMCRIVNITAIAVARHLQLRNIGDLITLKFMHGSSERKDPEFELLR
jgi:hypothetical protein